MTHFTGNSRATAMGEIVGAMSDGEIERMEREEFQMDVLEAVAAAGRAGVNLAGLGLLALRLQAREDRDCHAVLAAVMHGAIVQQARNELGDALLAGDENAVQALGKALDEAVATRRERLAWFAERGGATAKRLLAAIDRGEDPDA